MNPRPSDLDRLARIDRAITQVYIAKGSPARALEALPEFGYRICTRFNGRDYVLGYNSSDVDCLLVAWDMALEYGSVPRVAVHRTKRMAEELVALMNSERPIAQVYLRRWPNRELMADLIRLHRWHTGGRIDGVGGNPLSFTGKIEKCLVAWDVARSHGLHPRVALYKTPFEIRQEKARRRREMARHV